MERTSRADWGELWQHDGAGLRGGERGCTDFKFTFVTNLLKIHVLLVRVLLRLS